jgi:hypothetical protein
MDLLLCWLIAPALLMLALVGLSLLVERASGLLVPWTLRPALGMAAAIVVAQLGTATEATAKLTLPALIVLGLLGLVLGRELPERRPSRLEAGVFLAVFFLFALPFLVTGEATLAGYIKLDDSATWLGITDHVFSHGRGNLVEPAGSTYQQVLIDYLGGSYPIGGFVPMALMSRLSGQDIAFLFQPSMAFAVATMALGVFELGRRVLRGDERVAAAIAVIASLASLLIGYYLWGGIKEMVVAALLPLAPLLAGVAAGAGWPRRAWAPLGLAIAALLVVLGPGGAVWVLPTLLPAVVARWRAAGPRRVLAVAAPLAGFVLLLALPVIFTPTGVFDPLNGGVTGEAELGNLPGPLDFFQVAGVWPAIDFRFDPHIEPVTIAVAVLCLLLAAVAVVVAYRQGERDGVPLAGYVAGGALGAFAIVHYGSPWVDAKVMATLSPAILAGALLAVAMLGRRTGFRFEAAALAAVIGGFVLWSAFLAYQGIWFAPRPAFADLEQIGDRFAGEGPALDTEVSIYGPRHFLRDLEPEGASDRRVRSINLVAGGVPEDGSYVDLDEIFASELDPYALIVDRRSPAASRPPASFELAFQTDRYDVWRRREAPGSLAAHVPLGTELDAGDVPSCADVADLAAQAGEGGKLVAARVGTPIAVEFPAEDLPEGWTSPSPYSFAPSGSGTATADISVPGGTYRLWLEGAVFGGLTIRIDGEEVASERARVDNGGSYEPLGEVDLAAGAHTLEAEYEKGGLSPGSAAQPWSIGPLLLEEPEEGDPGLVTVDPSRYRRLCGQRWDWVEAYTG